MLPAFHLALPGLGAFLLPMVSLALQAWIKQTVVYLQCHPNKKKEKKLEKYMPTFSTCNLKEKMEKKHNS